MAEFEYRPTACQKTYRMVVVRKNICEVREGQVAAVRRLPLLLLHHQRSGAVTPAEVVFSANDRCDQENLIAQLKGGVRALHAPVDNLVSNWAYMVMTAWPGT